MRKRVVVAALVLVLGLNACGSDEDGGDGGSGAPATSVAGPAAEAPVELSGKVNDEGTEDATGKTELEVEADDFYFKPTFIKVTPGQKLTLSLRNEGQTPHTFTSPELAVDQELKAGDTASVEITVPDGEAVLFFCRFHRGGGMQGAVFTKEGGTVGAKSQASAPSRY